MAVINIHLAVTLYTGNYRATPVMDRGCWPVKLGCHLILSFPAAAVSLCAFPLRRNMGSTFKMFNEIIKSAGAACVVSKTNLIIGKMKKLFNYNDNSKKYKNR